MKHVHSLLCVYIDLWYIQLYTCINYHMDYINLFLWFLGTKNLHLHLHSTNPFGVSTSSRIHHSLLQTCPQATGSPRKSNWPRAHQQRMPKLPPLNHIFLRIFVSLQPNQDTDPQTFGEKMQSRVEKASILETQTGNPNVQKVGHDFFVNILWRYRHKWTRMLS